MAKFYAVAPNGDSAVLSISLQNMDQSLQQNGWCKLPNGLIIQWGQSSVVSGWNTWMNFSIRMTQCFVWVATGNVENDYGGGDHLTVYRAYHGGIVGRLFQIDDPAQALAFRTVMEHGPSASVIVLGY